MNTRYASSCTICEFMHARTSVRHPRVKFARVLGFVHFQKKIYFVRPRASARAAYFPIDSLSSYDSLCDRREDSKGLRGAQIGRVTRQIGGGRDVCA